MARPAPAGETRTGPLSLTESRGYGVGRANYSFLFKQWSGPLNFNSTSK
jgi:hypothetical protein